MRIAGWKLGAATLSVLALLLGACGDDDGDGDASDATAESGAANDDAGSDSDSGEADDAESDDGDGEASGEDGEPAESGGASFGEFTIDGTTVRYVMSDVEYSQVEGIDDITFENCDPSFFGASFVVIGYPVDDSGELVLAENGDIAGIVEAELPLEGGVAERDVEFSLDYDPLEVDVRYTESAGSTADYTIDGNNATGTVTLVNSAGDATDVDFEISCAA